MNSKQIIRTIIGAVILTFYTLDFFAFWGNRIGFLDNNTIFLDFSSSFHQLSMIAYVLIFGLSWKLIFPKKEMMFLVTEGMMFMLFMMMLIPVHLVSSVLNVQQYLSFYSSAMIGITLGWLLCNIMFEVTYRCSLHIGSAIDKTEKRKRQESKEINIDLVELENRVQRFWGIPIGVKQVESQVSISEDDAIARAWQELEQELVR